MVGPQPEGATNARWRTAVQDVITTERTYHWLSPVGHRNNVNQHHPRHTLARRELPEDVLTWTPKDVVRWVDGLDLHG